MQSKLHLQNWYYQVDQRKLCKTGNRAKENDPVNQFGPNKKVWYREKRHNCCRTNNCRLPATEHPKGLLHNNLLPCPYTSTLANNTRSKLNRKEQVTDSKMQMRKISHIHVHRSAFYSPTMKS
jgi:hypothetical protein